jgi:hypothetical protein
MYACLNKSNCNLVKQSLNIIFFVQDSPQKLCETVIVQPSEQGHQFGNSVANILSPRNMFL